MSSSAGAPGKKKDGKPPRRKARRGGEATAVGGAAHTSDAKGNAEDAAEGPGPEQVADQGRLEVHFSREEGLRFAALVWDPSRREALRQLVLVGQPASSLDGASFLSRISELWLVESQLEDAAAARECPLLEKLVLYSNRLRSIPDLSPLTRLSTLWLAGNFITSIKNLNKLPSLEDLNLADNLISSVGSGLRDCKRLNTLNLSGNPLATLTECRSLSPLQSLRSLTLADPLYGATPMSRLCNYRSCVLLHLPHLTALDGFSVEPEELEQVRGFYAAKARHLSMLRRHAEARYVLGVRQLGREAGRDLQRFRDHLFGLGQRECERWHSKGKQPRKEEPGIIAPTPEEVGKELHRWEEDLQIRLAEQEATFKMSLAQLECVLENVGNIAVGVHEENSQLAAVCQELLDRLSCCTRLAKYNIGRIRVLRVTHVCSRGAEIAERWRHAESQEQARERGQERGQGQERGPEPPPEEQGRAAPGQGMPSDQTEEQKANQRQAWSISQRSSTTSGGSGSGSVESATEGTSSPTQDGSSTQARSQQSPEAAAELEEEAVAELDCENMFLLLCHPSRELTFSPWPFKLLDYPSLGFAEDMEEQPLVCNCVPLADARWLRHQAQAPAPGRLHGVRRLAPLVRLARGTTLRRARRVEAHRSQPPRCRMYRVSGPRPELLFLAEFVYEQQDEVDAVGCPRAWWWRDVPAPTPAATRYPVLDESLLYCCIPAVNSNPDWTRLRHVNLAGRGIKVLGELPVLPSVVDLDLSYNQLGSLGSLYAFPNLRSLNLSFNDFTALINMRELPALESLDLSWNCVRQLLVVLRTLSKYAPRLRSLQVAHNPVEDVVQAAHGRHLASRYLSRLTLLDGCPVKREAVVLSRPSHSPALRPASRTVSRRPSTPGPAARQPAAEELQLRWRAEAQAQAGGPLQPDRHTLCAGGRHLTHVEDPESWLGSTRYADLSDNLLGQGHGQGHARCHGQALGQLLAAMPLLHSLNLARNALEALPLIAFQRCGGLRRLDLSGNYLQAASALATFPLPQLTFLDLSGNQLQSLSGLESLVSLEELYLANNRLRSLDDLQPLKVLQEVCVLDLTGNDVCAHANFKKFVVFHMQKLESVNGQAIVEGDLVSARETFGGCLDRDALLTQYVWKDLTHLSELSLPRADLRQVELPGTMLPQLTSLDLSHNRITCLWGLHELPSLVTLNLGYNKVRALGAEDLSTAIFPRLQTLFLNNNDLTCLKPLALERARELRTLFLQHNQLNELTGLGHPALSGLVLDSNRLNGSALTAAAGANLLLDVQELYIEGNNLEGLGFVSNIKNIRRLFLAKNKIMEACELNHLRSLIYLNELTLIGNPVCFRQGHYAQIKELLPQLELLDGHSTDSAQHHLTMRDEENTFHILHVNCMQ